MTTEDNILVLKDVSKSFFEAKVLHEVNLSVRQGEILGLVGENGAGKSTLMNILGGVLPMDSGSITLDGQPYTPTTPRSATQAGIAFIHQELNLFSNLTVAENLFIDDLPTSRGWAVQYRQMTRDAQTYLERFGVDAAPKAVVETLPMGVRQTIEISKALMKNARVIIFDEPTTSLSQKEKANLFRIIGQLKDQGVTIIYISHILEDVFRICDRIAVLRDGHMIGVSPAAAVTHTEVVRMMVGRELNQVFPTVEKEIGAVVFEANHIQKNNRVNDVSLALRSGEITGLFGLMGSGRTDLARLLFGSESMDAGEVTFRGRTHSRLSPRWCIENGIAFVTEDRRQEGLLMPKSVQENLVLVMLDKLTGSLGMVSRQREGEISIDQIANLAIKVQSPRKQPVKNLSGGNQQKVVLGKWLAREPQLFIMDEPTRGVDVGAKYDIYSIINEMAKNGATILFISSEMEELMGLCDRILVMHQGRITADVQRQDYDQETILRYALEGSH